jgi:uncharacterized protein with von Willebrand factor type A (vWA) domain
MKAAVVVDRWDREDLAQVTREVKVFARERRKLAAKVPWGGVALDDVFFLLFLARPQLVDLGDMDARHTVHHVLVATLAELDQVRRLRRATQRDPVAAATAAVTLAPQFAQATDDLGASPMLESALASASELQETGDGGDEWLEDRVRELQDELEASLEEGRSLAAVRLGEAAREVAEVQERQAAAAAVWGLSPGELRRMPAAERLELARQLDSPRMRMIVELFGRLRSSMYREPAVIPDGGIEPVGLELGGDLGRVTGVELLSLAGLDELFFARVGDGALVQYAVQGETDAGHGGIILCVDGSESMDRACQGYTREAWAQAVRLFLLRVAERDRRPLHVVNFGGPGELSEARFASPADFAPARVMGASTAWFGGGTDFEGPLKRALEIAAAESDLRADVVFVTDGECRARQRALDAYRAGVGRLGVRTWGLQLGGSWGGLASFCDRVFTVADLTSGRELGELLGGIAC